MTGVKSCAGALIQSRFGISQVHWSEIDASLKRVNSPLFNQRREQRSESLTNPKVVSSPQHHCFKDNCHFLRKSS